MAAGYSGASNERNMKNTRSYDTSTGQLVAKTPKQEAQTRRINKVKNLTNRGKHQEASKVYEEFLKEAN